MADSRQLQIILSVVDNASKSIEDAGKKVKGLSDFTGKLAVGFGVVGGAITGAMGLALKAYTDTEVQEKMLEHAVIGVSKATQGQLEATRALADELERKGVLDGDNIKQGLAQLSTFGLSNDAVRGLGGSLADLAVNQYGVSASGEQLSDTANMIAKALNGQFGVLEKSGIRFTEAQKAIIATGTEMEKVKAINEGFAQNLKFTNDIAKQTAEGGLAKLKVQFGNLMETVGKQLLPVLTKIVDAVSPVVQKIQDFANENPKLFNTIVLIVGALGLLMLGLAPILLILPGLIAFIGLLTPAVLAVVIPIMAVIAVLVLIGVAIYELIKNWDYLKGKTIEVWNNIVNSVGGALNAVVGVFNNIYSTIIGVVQNIWNGVTTIFQFALALLVGLVITYFDSMGIDIIGVFTSIIEFFTTTWQMIQSIFSIALDAIMAYWKFVWDTNMQTFMVIWNAIKSVAQVAWAFLTSLFKTASAPLQEGWKNMWEAIGSVFTVVWEGIKSGIKSGINWIIEQINSVIRAVNSVTQKGAGALKISVPSIPEIPKLAKGGIVNQPTIAMIGEAGPEAVVPLSKGGFGNITINISGNTLLSDDAGEIFANQIMDKLRFNTRIA